MAGGVHAAVMMCLHCAGKANRVREGVEDDGYECEECGRTFGVDWSRRRPEAPLWPPSPAEQEALRRLVAARRRLAGQGEP